MSGAGGYYQGGVGLFSSPPSQAAIHAALLALYTSTGGQGWQSTQNWFGGVTTSTGVPCLDLSSALRVENNVPILGGRSGTVAVSTGSYTFTDVAQTHAFNLHQRYNKCTITVQSGTLASAADGGYYYGTVQFSIPSACTGWALDLRTQDSTVTANGVDRLVVESDSARTWCLDPCLSALATDGGTHVYPRPWAGITCESGAVVEISLPKNGLTGTVPTQLGHIAGSLTRLELYGNRISGTLPGTLGTLTELDSEMSLGESSLSGTLPLELALVTKVRALQFGRTRMSGTLPSQYNALTELSFLDVSESMLSGTLVSTALSASEFNLFSLTSLSSFPRTQGTPMSGTLPTEIGKLTRLKSGLAFQDTQLSGTLPTQVGSLTALNDGIYVYNSSLSGSIPSELAVHAELGFPTLHSNLLSGTLPSELGAFSDIGFPCVSYNSLSGTIPEGFKHTYGRIDFYSNFVDEGQITDNYYSWHDREFQWIRTGQGLASDRVEADAQGLIPTEIRILQKLQELWWSTWSYRVGNPPDFWQFGLSSDEVPYSGHHAYDEDAFMPPPFAPPSPPIQPPLLPGQFISHPPF